MNHHLKILLILPLVLGNCAQTEAGGNNPSKTPLVENVSAAEGEVCFVQNSLISKPGHMSGVVAQYALLRFLVKKVEGGGNNTIQMPRISRESDYVTLYFILTEPCDVAKDAFQNAMTQQTMDDASENIRSGLELTNVKGIEKAAAPSSMTIVLSPRDYSVGISKERPCSRSLQFPGVSQPEFSIEDAALVLSSVMTELGVDADVSVRNEIEMEVQLNEFCDISNIIIETILYEAQRISPPFLRYGGSWALSSH